MAKRKAQPAVADATEAPVRPHVGERGEIALPLGGMDYVLRPSHEAIEEFQALTGKGLMQLTRDALQGSMTTGECAQIATECIRAWGRATNKASAIGVNAPRVSELILESDGGFHAAITTVAGMLSLASTGGYTAQGELKAGTTKTNGAPAENP